MKALYFDGELSVKELPEPEPRDGEALIRVTLAGVCRTDLEIVKGYMNFTGALGHEFVGIVETAPDEKWVGRRVVGEINVACGDCAMCQAGHPRHCTRREVLGIAGRDGSFAEKICLPQHNLYAVPPKVDDYKAVFTEPLAACYEILEQVRPGMGERVLVIGDGRLGILAAAVLKGYGASVVLAGRHSDKLELAQDKFGLEAVPSDIVGAEKFSFVVECSGKPSGLELAASVLRPRGILVLKSTYNEKPCVDMAHWVINEITIVGSRCGPFAPALLSLANGVVDPTPLIEEVYPFEKILEAFEAAGKPGSKKVLIDFQ